MFPNNVDFFVKERIAGRYADAEKHRLAQALARQTMPRLKLWLGKVIYWSGCQIISWGETLRYPDKTPGADQPERLTP